MKWSETHTAVSCKRSSHRKTDLGSLFLPQDPHRISELTTIQAPSRISTLTRHDPSIRQHSKQTTLTNPPTSPLSSQRTSPSHHIHNNGRPHALGASQRSFRPSCHQLRPDSRILRPSRLPDLATDDGCCRRAGAQARGRVQGNVSLSKIIKILLEGMDALECWDAQEEDGCVSRAGWVRVEVLGGNGSTHDEAMETTGGVLDIDQGTGVLTMLFW